MDPRLTPPHSPSVEDDGWDAEGFEIPSLETIRPKKGAAASRPVPASTRSKSATSESLYLGPYGAPPSQSKQQQQQEAGAVGSKQRLKHKLKDAEKKAAAVAAQGGRENKVEVLRDLMGSLTDSSQQPTGQDSSREWLEPYCHESQFERRSQD